MLKIEKFDAETVAKAAESVVEIVKSGVDIAKEFGIDVNIPGLENGELLGQITSVIGKTSSLKSTLF